MPRAQVSSKAAFQLQLVQAPEQELVELRDFCQAILIARKKAKEAAEGVNARKPRRVSKAKAAAATAKAAEVTGKKGKVYGTGPVAAPAAEVLT